MQRKPRALLPHGLETRTWAFSSHGAECDRASDTPVAPSVFPHASSTFADAAIWPYDATFGLAVRVGGFRERQDHR
jgi:hypothetical protein